MQQSQKKRERREKAWSSGLAELAVNLGRFIFSGAFRLLKGGEIYMPLPGPLCNTDRGDDDGRGRGRLFFAQVMEVTGVGGQLLAVLTIRPKVSRVRGGAFQLAGVPS